ncbi:response regulator transcription factor [Flavobacterium capsici]|uniref:Response regulator transcription factor n=1 Tax=Flavobacterium capsici TaxID=3075618 RepID=A0AA96F573_9FLAO|nr:MULTISPECIES: response regulator transcription factor [unclassified Flavobacterium]WNM18947.1 response regulator transcription factor [Flavobacterium sp. PMR2A8]WNM22997.1 response regulator transcription factor [Flavobacterium sp. PMTSA4]
MKYSIAIVDDHTLIAKALSGIISTFNDFEVLYECENGKELQEKFLDKNNHPKIVLLDVSMPIMNGFETAKWLTENHPDVYIMALSMQNEDQSVIKMVKNGAKGYLLKNTYPADLETALLTMVKNGFYYPEWAANKIFNSIGQKTEPSKKIDSSLTERELEFLKYVATELSYKEIGELMSCSARTVENYRDSVCEKLQMKTRIGLAVYAIKSGLIVL